MEQFVEFVVGEKPAQEWVFSLRDIQFRISAVVTPLSQMELCSRLVVQGLRDNPRVVVGLYTASED